MIIGRGDIASILKDKDNYLFFASGVSNSQERRFSEFWREVNLLLAQPKDKHLVYFGSLSIFYADSPYTQHKRRMEALIKKNFPSYTIVRIGNISWGDNPHTLINYLKAHLDAPVHDVYRYVIDKDEFLHRLDTLPVGNSEINLLGRCLKVKDIKDEYV